MIEAKLERGRGPVGTVLVQRGTLRQGEIFVAGATMGRVRAMFDDRGMRIEEATASMAVQILGFEDVPVSGDNFQIVENEAKARIIVSFRQEKNKAAALAKQRVTLENIWHECIDVRRRPSSITHSQAEVVDGRVRLVASATDPGTGNWLDTGLTTITCRAPVTSACGAQ